MSMYISVFHDVPRTATGNICAAIFLLMGCCNSPWIKMRPCGR